MKLAVAFQINKAEFVVDIVDDEATVPELEHYSMYTPSFADGRNIADALDISVSFLYFRSVNHESDSYLIDSVDSRVHYLSAVPSLKIEGDYFIALESERGEYKIDLEYGFGKHYASIMNIAEQDKYVYEVDGVSYSYILVDINEFANEILK